MRHLITLALTGALLVTGCATTGEGGPPRPQTAMQRAQGQCLVAIGVGALLGAVIGNNTGSGNASRGAGKGAIAGVGICAVLMVMASAEDKRRIQEAEYAALETGQDRDDSYVGSDGKRRTIHVHTETAPDRSWALTPASTTAGETASLQAAAVTTTATDICRYSQTTLSAEGAGTGSLDRGLYCRNPQTRAWEPQNG